MYSTKIIQRSQEALEQRFSQKLTRYEPGESLNRAEYVAKLWDRENAVWKRAPRQEELDFIRNERLLSAIDYHYWTRYANILRDPAVGGGLGPFTPWGAQIIVLNLIASMEETMVEAYERGEPVDGILLAIHKARQLGATMLVRTLHMHRITTTPHVRAGAASLDEDKVLKLYERDKRIYDNLPHYLQPEIGFEEKAKHLSFSELDSSMMYQELVQRSGLFQGEQYDLGHITEAASTPYPSELEHNYFPTIPQSPYALHVMETTAQGRDNYWRFFVEDIRKGGTRWKLVFVPWYAEPLKYRRQPPPDWVPNEEALLHAQVVYDTSLEYLGRHVMLGKEQLYWYVTTREEYRRKNNLNLFLTNFCSTIEESFQHTTESVFSPELLAFFRDRCNVPAAYEVVGGGGGQ